MSEILNLFLLILAIFLVFKFRSKFIWMPTILIIAAYIKWKCFDPIVLQFKLWSYKPRDTIDPLHNRRLLTIRDRFERPD